MSARWYRLPNFQFAAEVLTDLRGDDKGRLTLLVSGVHSFKRSPAFDLPREGSHASTPMSSLGSQCAQTTVMQSCNLRPAQRSPEPLFFTAIATAFISYSVSRLRFC